MADEVIAYRRARFATRLPADRYYTESHSWVAPAAEGGVRVGFTPFATRMLGEVVELDFEVQAGARVETGQTIGWIEGFKAVSDLYAPLEGVFAGANPRLAEAPDEVHRAPFEAGWLYRLEEADPSGLMRVTDYVGFLDATIDRMMGGPT